MSSADQDETYWVEIARHIAEIVKKAVMGCKVKFERVGHFVVFGKVVDLRANIRSNGESECIHRKPVFLWMIQTTTHVDGVETTQTVTQSEFCRNAMDDYKKKRTGYKFSKDVNATHEINVAVGTTYKRLNEVIPTPVAQLNPEAVARFLGDVMADDAFAKDSSSLNVIVSANALANKNSTGGRKRRRGSDGDVSAQPRTKRAVHQLPVAEGITLPPMPEPEEPTGVIEVPMANPWALCEMTTFPETYHDPTALFG